MHYTYYNYQTVEIKIIIGVGTTPFTNFSLHLHQDCVFSIQTTEASFESPNSDISSYSCGKDSYFQQADSEQEHCTMQC